MTTADLTQSASQSRPLVSTNGPVDIDKYDGRSSPLAYRWLLWTLFLVFIANILVFAMRPGEDSSYAVIVPPHLGQPALMDVLASADGVLVRESRYPWLAIISPANETARDGFAQALRQAGAVLLLHPAILAGCFTPNSHAGSTASGQVPSSSFQSF